MVPMIREHQSITPILSNYILKKDEKKNFEKWTRTSHIKCLCSLIVSIFTWLSKFNNVSWKQIRWATNQETVEKDSDMHGLMRSIDLKWILEDACVFSTYLCIVVLWTSDVI